MTDQEYACGVQPGELHTLKCGPEAVYVEVNAEPSHPPRTIGDYERLATQAGHEPDPPEPGDNDPAPASFELVEQIGYPAQVRDRLRAALPPAIRAGLHNLTVQPATTAGGVARHGSLTTTSVDEGEEPS